MRLYEGMYFLYKKVVDKSKIDLILKKFCIAKIITKEDRWKT
jgi:hypothetical protein